MYGRVKHPTTRIVVNGKAYDIVSWFGMRNYMAFTTYDGTVYSLEIDHASRGFIVQTFTGFLTREKYRGF